MKFIKWFDEVGTSDVGLVGGKNTSLGEMIRNLRKREENIVLSEFAITAAYNPVIEKAGIREKIRDMLADLDTHDMENVSTCTRDSTIRERKIKASCPEALVEKIRFAYKKMQKSYISGAEIAVRSSATAEDPRTASFAGQQETYLNVKGVEELLKMARGCFVPLFTTIAILRRDKKSNKKYQVTNEKKKVRDEKNPLPPSWISKLDRIIAKMLEFQDDDGGFRATEGGEKSCFSTIEALYPLLLHPQTERWVENIIAGINYIFKKNTKDGKISPAPEYPNIAEDCSVDSMAYGLYVFSLARHCIGRNMSKSEEKENLLSQIDKQIERCIKYIEDNQNRDGGWPLVKDSSDDIKSRTYSTALVIFALSNCEKEVFKESKKGGKSLIRDGANFLIENNNNLITESQDMRAWFFSQPRDNDELAELKTKPSVNLTAVVVFSLSHLLRSEWKSGWDPKIPKAIREGARYISKNTFNESGEEITLSVEEDSEPVDYPVYDENSKGKGLKTKGYDNAKKCFNKKKGFIFPYEMILPALVLVPGYSVKSRKILELRNHIYKKIEQTRKSITDPCRLFDYSDKIFALEYQSYIEHVLEECLDRYVKKGDVIPCLIDKSKKCPHMCSIVEQKESIIQKIQNRWGKLHGWTKGLSIQIAEVGCTIPLVLSWGSKSMTTSSELGLTSDAIWTIYAVIQALIAVGLQGYYQTTKQR